MKPHLLVVVDNADNKHAKDALVISAELLRNSRLLPQPDSTRIADVMDEHLGFTYAHITGLSELTDWLGFVGDSWEDLKVDWRSFVQKADRLNRVLSIDGCRFTEVNQVVIDTFGMPDSVGTSPFTGAEAIRKAARRQHVRESFEITVLNTTLGKGHSGFDAPIHLEPSHDIRDNGKVIARIKAAVDMSTTKLGRGHVMLVTVEGKTLVDADDMELDVLPQNANLRSKGLFTLQAALEMIMQDCAEPIETADFPDARDWINQHRPALYEALAEMEQSSGVRAVSALEGPQLTR